MFTFFASLCFGTQAQFRPPRGGSVKFQSALGAENLAFICHLYSRTHILYDTVFAYDFVVLCVMAGSMEWCHLRQPVWGSSWPFGQPFTSWLSSLPGAGDTNRLLCKACGLPSACHWATVVSFDEVCTFLHLLLSMYFPWIFLWVVVRFCCLLHLFQSILGYWCVLGWDYGDTTFPSALTL